MSRPDPTIEEVKERFTEAFVAAGGSPASAAHEWEKFRTQRAAGAAEAAVHRLAYFGEEDTDQKGEA